MDMLEKEDLPEVIEQPTKPVYYKVLDEGGKPIIASQRHGGVLCWELPVGKRPGKWMPKMPVVMCVSGWHMSPIGNIEEWIKLNAYLYEAEGRGKCLGEDNPDEKIVFEEARLVRLIGKITPFKLARVASRIYREVRFLAEGTVGISSYDKAQCEASIKGVKRNLEKCALNLLDGGDDYDVIQSYDSIKYDALEAVERSTVGMHRDQRRWEMYRKYGEWLVEEIGKNE